MDLTKPWDSGDVTFIVEGRKIFANKLVLAISSEVFKAMFTSEFKERKMSEIPLPEKKFDDFLVFMQLMHPLPRVSVNNSNVESLLHLAQEYLIPPLIKDCEKVLIKQPPSIHNLILGDKFYLAELRQVFFKYLKSVPYSKLESDPEFKMVDKDTRIEVFERHSLHQEPSIENLFLAEKYNVPEVYEKCLQYLKDTPFTKLKDEPGFKNVKQELPNEVLQYKVEKLETIIAEARAIPIQYCHNTHYHNNIVCQQIARQSQATRSIQNALNKAG